MRFGLVGAGPWARMTHGPGLVAADGVELVGVWARRPEQAASLAGDLGVAAYDDYDALLAEVDAVAFAVPPDVQASMALAAARAGKHLLLDKPVALDVPAARTLADASAAAGIASVVFFTDRFIDTARAWFDQITGTGGWHGGWLRWFSTLQDPGNPFGQSRWRWDHGALWDLGPHAISTLGAALGPVVSLTAVPGPEDLVTLVLRHESGASSTATLTSLAAPAAVHFEATVWGVSGLLPMPPRPEGTGAERLATAATELVASAASGRPHEVGLAFGTHVVELLADAQAQLDAARAGR